MSIIYLYGMEETLALQEILNVANVLWQNIVLILLFLRKIQIKKLQIKQIIFF